MRCNQFAPVSTSGLWWVCLQLVTQLIWLHSGYIAIQKLGYWAPMWFCHFSTISTYQSYLKMATDYELSQTWSPSSKQPLQRQHDCKFIIFGRAVDSNHPFLWLYHKLLYFSTVFITVGFKQRPFNKVLIITRVMIFSKCNRGVSKPNKEHSTGQSALFFYCEGQT